MGQPVTHDFSLWLEMRGECAAEINLSISALTTASSILWTNHLCLASRMNYFTLVYLDDNPPPTF